MTTQEDTSFCSNVVTLPQFGGTCWFNAILTVALYSEGSRKILLKNSKNWENNTFLNSIKKLLKVYKLKNNFKTIKILHKYKPETILLLMLNKINDISLKNTLKLQIKNDGYNSIGWIKTYITMFYKNLNVNVLDITVLNIYKPLYLLNFYKYINLLSINDFNDLEKLNDDNYRNFFLKLNFKENKLGNEIDEKDEIEKKLTHEPPDILVIYHYELDNIIVNSIKNFYKFYLKYNKIAAMVHNSSGYHQLNNLIIGIDTYENEITFGSNNYVLDSCIINNYDDDITYSHSTAGIHCEGNKYIYNSWALNNPVEKLITSCPLQKYDWNLKDKNDFCFKNDECGIEKIIKGDKRELCYSFSKGQRTLIYVKKEKLREESMKELIEESIEESREESKKKTKKESIVLSSNESMYDEIKETIYDIHDILNLTEEDLKKQIIIFNPIIENYIKDETDINFLRDLLYQYIVSYHKKYDIEVSEEFDEEKKRKEEEELILRDIKKFFFKKLNKLNLFIENKKNDPLKSKIDELKSKIDELKSKSDIKLENYYKLYKDLESLTLTLNYENLDSNIKKLDDFFKTEDEKENIKTLVKKINLYKDNGFLLIEKYNTELIKDIQNIIDKKEKEEREKGEKRKRGEEGEKGEEGKKIRKNGGKRKILKKL